MHPYTEAMKKYAVMSGRSSRSELWQFYVINVGVLAALKAISWLIDCNAILGSDPNSDAAVAPAWISHIPAGSLAIVYMLVILVPSIAVGVRRMHDTGRSGWWGMAPFINLAFWASVGQPGDNKYGPAPKAVKSVAA